VVLWFRTAECVISLRRLLSSEDPLPKISVFSFTVLCPGLSELLFQERYSSAAVVKIAMPCQWNRLKLGDGFEA